MNAGALIALGIGAVAIFWIASGGIQKAKDYFKEDLDKTPATEGGSAPARPESSQEQNPLTDKERKTNEAIKKMNEGLDKISNPDDLPRNDSDLSAFDTKTRSINSQTASHLSKENQKLAHEQRELAIPNSVKYSSSLAGSVPTTGKQIKREEPVVITNAKSLGGSSALQQKIILEQERAKKISETLYGNVQNSSFVKDTKTQVSNPQPSETQKSETAKEKNARRLAEAQEYNRKQLAIQAAKDRAKAKQK